MMSILNDHYKKHGLDQHMADEKCSRNIFKTRNAFKFHIK
jgi:hypothetical protein